MSKLRKDGYLHSRNEPISKLSEAEITHKNEIALAPRIQSGVFVPSSMAEYKRSLQRDYHPGQWLYTTGFPSAEKNKTKQNKVTTKKKATAIYGAS